MKHTCYHNANRTRILQAALVQLLLCSCMLQEPEGTPFIVSVPVCSTGECKPWWNAIGITFDFWNVSEKDIQEISVDCYIYDSTTGLNPFTGSNHIGVQFSGLIEKKTKASLALPLDPYIVSIPDKPYIVDKLTICSITYTDGSEWKNPEYQILHLLTQGVIQ